jgi:hypothetical protein
MSLTLPNAASTVDLTLPRHNFTSLMVMYQLTRNIQLKRWKNEGVKRPGLVSNDEEF